MEEITMIYLENSDADYCKSRRKQNQTHSKFSNILFMLIWFRLKIFHHRRFLSISNHYVLSRNINLQTQCCFVHHSQGSLVVILNVLFFFDNCLPQHRSFNSKTLFKSMLEFKSYLVQLFINQFCPSCCTLLKFQPKPSYTSTRIGKPLPRIRVSKNFYSFPLR